MPTKISTCIIGYNEEAKVEDCLRSVSSITDEIVFVDSYSNDKTISIVEKYTNNIYRQKFLGHVEQKNLAVSKANNDWVLCLDCDERLSTISLESIKKNLLRLDDYHAYSFNRLTYYIYRWIYHSGWYPDRKVRLFNRNHCCWGGENPHDRVCCNSPAKIKHLAGDILHYSFDSISDHIKTLDSFSTIGAQKMHEKGRKSNIFIIMGRTFWVFFRKFFLEFAYLDGIAGIILTGFSIAATWSKYSKLYILNQQKKNHDFLTKNKIP